MSQISTLQSPTDSLDVIVGRKVHMIMWDRRISQIALGKMIGIDQSSLSKRLRGERGWGLDDLKAVAAALDISMSYLLGESSDPTPRPPDGDGWAPWGSNPRPAD